MNGSDGTADLPIDNLEPCFHLDKVFFIKIDNYYILMMSVLYTNII